MGLKSENATWPMWPQVAKSGSKYENLNGTRWSSNFDANWFVSPRQAFSFFYLSKLNEKWPSYGHLKFCQKWQNGHFLANNPMVWPHFFKISSYNFVCPSLSSKVMGKPICRHIWLKMAILSHKNIISDTFWPLSQNYKIAILAPHKLE